MSQIFFFLVLVISFLALLQLCFTRTLKNAGASHVANCFKGKMEILLIYKCYISQLYSAPPPHSLLVSIP